MHVACKHVYVNNFKHIMDGRKDEDKIRDRIGCYKIF